MRNLERVCVYGAGTLGWQIALQCASHGRQLSIYDISARALESASLSITTELDAWLVAEKTSAVEKRSMLERIKFEADAAEAVRGVDLVIEAVPEKLDIKRRVFKKLDKICGEETIIATNSSSIRISLIENATMRLDRVLNTHFYSFPWRSRVVELMRGTITSDETVASVGEFMRSIGMVPLFVRKESTGFIFNRVWRAVKRECLHLVDEGVASFEDVDRAWMCIYGMDSGPFGLMDRIGLDVVRDIENVYYGESHDLRDAPPRLLLEKIEKGELGVKSSKGFYSYPNPAYRKPGWLDS
ncbi:MAG: 3-hydroxyacyl-CoA dehydrogenase NAD-binding domain-containing protein [Candidatus Bathyarchaeota archaeon]|nr:3-hydroxyacyl-CoA dehydrogenase NAD-binding domain-containing protein [Candidatus Bathyarchaeota archaeon]